MAPQQVRQGELALVLHSHMPYVEGFGTWPFGEEWLWEAIATSYLPLLDVLGAPGGQPVTLSLTPVLADQLEVAGALERCVAFLADVRPESHRLDIAELRGRPVRRRRRRARALRRRIRGGGAAAARAPSSGGGGLLGALAPHVRWTSAATHAMLPLLATDGGVASRSQTGMASHRRRFGGWNGGFWLPECATRRGWTRCSRRGGARHLRGADRPSSGSAIARHLRPLAAAGRAGAVADRPRHDGARLGDGGYPSRARLPRLPSPHRPTTTTSWRQRRRALRPCARAWRRPAPTRPSSWPTCGERHRPDGGVLRVRPGHRAARTLVV